MSLCVRQSWCFAALLLPLVLSSTGCSRHGAGAPVGGSDVKPSKVVLHRTVDLTRAEKRSLVYRVETVGVLEAEGQTDIAAGVPGVVDEVNFREGDFVEPTMILVKIDQARYEADEQVAVANAERAKAAMDLNRDLLERVEKAGAAISDEDRSKYRGNFKVTEAEYRAAQATLARARHNLNRSRVRPPYAGRINKRLVTKGTYLEEKTSIATIADLSKIRLVGYVPETAAPVVRELLRSQEARLEGNRLGLSLSAVGQPVPAWSSLPALHLLHKDLVPSGFDPEFELLAVPGVTFHARIFYMSTVANPDTHMFEAKSEVLGLSGELIAKHMASTPFWPGFTARIRFPLKSNPRACVVPEEAVRASERGFIAFVPEEQTGKDGKSDWIARARTLELGFRADGWVEVRRGLSAGEWLVRRGAEALEDGTPITFTKPAADGYR